MRKLVLLLQLQVLILSVLQAKWAIAGDADAAVVKPKPTEKPKQPEDGICADGKTDPVDTKKHWKDVCYDIEGNSYKNGESVMSCCGCFKFICSIKKGDVPAAAIIVMNLAWNKVLEDSCCEDCEGNVFPSGSVMKEKILEDKCATTLTTKCIVVRALEWKLIFRQTVPHYYKKGQLTHNTGDPGAPNYSILGDLAKFSQNGKFTLKLVWPGLGTEQEWSQTSNPITPGTVTGYQSINTPYTGCYFGGLQYSNGPALLEGSTNAWWWFYAVASFAKWSTGIPGPCTGSGSSSKGIPVQKVELYVEGTFKRKKAVIEESSSYGKCCTNSSGIYPIGTAYNLIPELCSYRKCLRPEGRHEASWILNQIEEGCNCCVHGTKLIGDGGWVILSDGKNATCCDGRLLVNPEIEITTGPPTGFADEKCFHEDTKITFHDLGKNQYGQDTKPVWEISDGGRTLTETENTRPSVGVTNLGDASRPVSFTGRAYSNTGDRDVIGMVFGYHNASQFFVVASAGLNRGPTNWYVGRLHAKCGTECALTTTISNAIWNPSLYPLDITVLASGTNYWSYPNKYRFSICFEPAKLKIDVSVINLSNGTLELNTGAISGATGKPEVDAISKLGGHIGVYVDSQAQTVWDELDCTDCRITDDVLPSLLVET